MTGTFYVVVMLYASSVVKLGCKRFKSWGWKCLNTLKKFSPLSLSDIVCFGWSYDKFYSLEAY